MDTDEILRRYSTPGLRRNILTRREKREQLAGSKIKGEAAERILNALYPTETPCPPETTPKS